MTPRALRTGLLCTLLLAAAVLVSPPVLGALLSSDGRIDPPWRAKALWVACVLTALLGLALPTLGAGPRHRIETLLLRTGLLGLSVLGALALLEVGLRLASAGAHDEQVTAHEFAYRVHYNSDGYRDVEFERDKRPGTFRVLALGDSFIFGTGVADEDSIPTRLEATLPALVGGPVEVFNLGQPGHDTHDSLREARRFAGYGADLVLYALFVDNDIEEHAPSTRLTAFASDLEVVRRLDRALVPAPAEYRAGLSGLDPECVALADARKVNPTLFVRALVGGENHAYYEELARRFVELPYTRDNLLATVAALPGTPFLLVLLPSKYQVNAAYLADGRKFGLRFARDEPLSEAPQRAVLEWAAAHAIDCLDVLPALRPDPGLRCFYRYDDHLTPAGNRAVADFLAGAIAARLARQSASGGPTGQ